MAYFCRRALAYMTGQPLEAFGKKKQPELSELLLHSAAGAVPAADPGRPGADPGRLPPARRRPAGR